MGKFKKTQQKGKKEKQKNNRKKAKKIITKIYKKIGPIAIATDFLFLDLTKADIINKIKLDVFNAF